MLGVAEVHEHEHEAWVAKMLDSPDRFPEVIDEKVRAELFRATRDVEDEIFDVYPSYEEEARAGKEVRAEEAPLLRRRCAKADCTYFPKVLEPLPGCVDCIDGKGDPIELKDTRRGSRQHYAWQFVGRSIKLVPVKKLTCVADAHEDPYTVNHRPAGVAWSKRTGLFNVGDAWFFSLLLLEDVTKRLRFGTCTPSAACAIVIDDSISFMRDMGHGEDIANLDAGTAERKLYDAWYAYEMALKRITDDDEDSHSICRFCGILPPKTGSDGCAKVAINLSTDILAGRLDYNEHPDEPLWTQEALFRHCHRRLMRRITPGSYASLNNETPIPVDLVPPVFHNKWFAADELHNTESEKRKSKAKGAKLKNSLDDPPTTETLARVAALVKLGELDPVRLRDPLFKQGKILDRLLDLAKCPPEVKSKLASSCSKREWLLAAYETLHAGESDCHLFTITARGTGGTVTLTCPHGVVIVYKFIFSGESDRDHADLLRCLRVHPACHWMDDSCGLVTFWMGMFPEEYDELFGENRGCPKPWKTGDAIDLSPVRRAQRAKVHAASTHKRMPITLPPPTPSPPHFITT